MEEKQKNKIKATKKASLRQDFEGQVKKVSKPKVAKKEKTALAGDLKKPVVNPDSIGVKNTKTEKIDLSLPVFDTKGIEIEKIILAKNIFGVAVNKSLLAQAVRVFLANQRSGTATTKTRGEVDGSTRKIYRQKGTGRARHGGARAPIFVHGGIVFGPKPRDYSMSMPKKMKKAALSGALSLQAKNKGIRIIANLEKIAPKTREMVKVLEALSLNNKKNKTLLITPAKIDAITKSARNIPTVSVMQATQLNAYTVLNAKTMIFTKDSLTVLEKHFEKEEK